MFRTLSAPRIPAVLALLSGGLVARPICGKRPLALGRGVGAEQGANPGHWRRLQRLCGRGRGVARSGLRLRQRSARAQPFLRAPRADPRRPGPGRGGARQGSRSGHGRRSKPAQGRAHAVITPQPSERSGRGHLVHPGGFPASRAPTDGRQARSAQHGPAGRVRCQRCLGAGSALSARNRVKASGCGPHFRQCSDQAQSVPGGQGRSRVAAQDPPLVRARLALPPSPAMSCGQHSVQPSARHTGGRRLRRRPGVVVQRRCTPPVQEEGRAKDRAGPAGGVHDAAGETLSLGDRADVPGARATAWEVTGSA